MLSNPVIETLMRRKSIRKYKPEMPSDEVIETIVRAGQQAPFAYQLGSVLLSRKREKHPFKAPLLFLILVDSHRLELVMARRGWQRAQNDLSMLLMGIQDAAYMAENMVIAAESLGLGSCFIGGIPYDSEQLIAQHKLPARVFPLVGLVMGYPAQDPPTRPRYPLEFSLFEGEYPQFDEQTINSAMRTMDEGYLAQDYYRKAKYQIPLEVDKPETYTFETYSWTEHISRKVGQWLRQRRDIVRQLKACGFEVDEVEGSDE